MTEMKAAVASTDGLKIATIARPAIGDNDILVKVHAAGVNRADLFSAANPDALGKPIGMEWAGEVVETGSGVDAWRVGDRVACMGMGGYAEYAVADQHLALPIPENISHETAAVLPLALMTAHNALDVAGFRSGETVFVHGAASGVGLAAIQIASRLGASQVFASSRKTDKRERLLSFSATRMIDSGKENWSADILQATGGNGVDVVVDMVTGASFNETMQATAKLGRIVNVGRLGGMTADVDFNLHALRRLAFFGVTFRTRSLDEVREIVRKVKTECWPLVAEERLSLPVDRSFSLDEAVAALDHMAADRHFGKLAVHCDA